MFGITVGAMRSAIRPPPEVAVPYAGVLKSPETLKRVREEEATFARKKLKDTKIVISNEAAVAVTRRKSILMDTVTVNRLGKDFRTCLPLIGRLLNDLALYSFTLLSME